MKHPASAYALALVLACPGAFAATARPADESVGFLAGAALSLDGSNLEDFIEAPLTGANADYQGGGIGADINAGLVLGQYVQLRLGHRTFGDQEADIFNGSTLTGKAELEASGHYFAADLMAPVMDQVSLGVTLGSLQWHGELTVRGGGGAGSSRESGSDLFAGLRGLVRLNDRFWITAFATRYELDTGDEEDLEYGILGAGLQARF